MAAGNLLALFQRNIKRLLAYSSIAHFGYLLVAFMSAGPFRVAAVTYYLVAYFVTTLGAFGVVTLLSANGAGRRRNRGLRGALLAAALARGDIHAHAPVAGGDAPHRGLHRKGVYRRRGRRLFPLAAGDRPGRHQRNRPLLLPAGHRRPLQRCAARPGRRPPAALKGRAVMVLLFILLIWWGIYPGPLLTIINRITLAP